MINCKSQSELEKMRRSGRIVRQVLELVKGMVAPGVSTMDLEHAAEDKIRELGITNLVDDVVISEQEGLRKPDRRIFDRALQRLCVEAIDGWYVGDHPVVDIRGAFDAGLTAVWRRTSYWQAPDVCCHRINSLDELLQILF